MLCTLPSPVSVRNMTRANSGFWFMVVPTRCTRPARSLARNIAMFDPIKAELLASAHAQSEPKHLVC